MFNDLCIIACTNQGWGVGGGVNPLKATAQVGAVPDVRAQRSCIILSALTAMSLTVLALGKLEPQTGQRRSTPVVSVLSWYNVAVCWCFNVLNVFFFLFHTLFM